MIPISPHTPTIMCCIRGIPIFFHFPHVRTRNWQILFGNTRSSEKEFWYTYYFIQPFMRLAHTFTCTLKLKICEFNSITESRERLFDTKETMIRTKARFKLENGFITYFQANFRFTCNFNTIQLKVSPCICRPRSFHYIFPCTMLLICADRLLEL